MMGICPQHDILFDVVSVEEHLQIYCNFKGVSNEEQQHQIDQIILNLGLSEHRYTMAKDLSGGTKRKLSVALALVADSKIVFLDEPTSGMDLNASRKFWAKLKEYKNNRIIILTTHNMDEAEFLGDKVGIMMNGRLQCLGTPNFLKSRLEQSDSLKI